MKALIVDDERLARNELKRLIHQIDPSIEIIALCENAHQAIVAIEEHEPDVVFLDIHMPEINGFELLEKIIYTPHIIFITAYDQYAIKAFDVNALDYLLKPVDVTRLHEAINKISDITIKEQNTDLSYDQKIFIKDRDNCWFVSIKNIPLFESEGNYARVYFDNNKPLIHKSLNLLEEKLPEDHFFRANRKAIINLNHITNVESWFNNTLKVTLSNNLSLEISRRQSAKLKKKLSI